MPRYGNTEKMSVTLPRELVREVKKLVPHGKASAFFTEALQHYLAVHKQNSALKKGFGAWKKESHPDLLTPEDAVLYVHSLRKSDNERLLRVRERRGK